jgi:hypothetical protein
VATDDLHAPLGLERPAAGRPILYSVVAAALGITTAAVVIGIVTWHEPLTRGLPGAPQAAMPAAAPAAAKPEAPVAASASVMPHVIQVPGTAAPPSPSQATGAISPAAALDGAKDQPPAPGTERIITIIDGRSGARQEVRIPATSDAPSAPLPDPEFGDLRTFPDADEAPEPVPQPPRAKAITPPKRAAKPGQTLSTNSASPAPLR